MTACHGHTIIDRIGLSKVREQQSFFIFFNLEVTKPKYLKVDGQNEAFEKPCR